MIEYIRIISVSLSLVFNVTVRAVYVEINTFARSQTQYVQKYLFKQIPHALSRQ